MRKRKRSNIVSRYVGERSTWKEAGKPMRSDEEVQRIFKEHCEPCEYFRKGRGDSGKCRLCGCSINIGQSTNFNKLRWATTQCPDNPPRWTAEVTKDTESPEVPQVEEKKEPEAPEKKETRREARQRRRREREQRRKDKELRLGAMPEQVRLPRGEDPLEITTRYLEPAGHVLRDMWKMCPAFLVCGGPSINQLNLELLKHPAVCSMGVNNVAGYAPVKSFVFSDPVEKFHHGIFLNPGIIKFAPHKKLNHRVRAKKEDGTFEFTTLRAGDFPSIFGFKRNSEWNPHMFLRSKEASWGCGKVSAAKLKRENVLFTPFLGIRLLHYLGVKRIYIIGMDFQMVSGETGGYAFNQGRTSGAASSNNVHYKRVNKMMNELKPIIDAAELEIYNCNKDSRCSAFEYVSYEDGIKDCLSMMPPEPYDLSGFYEKDRRLNWDGDDEEHRE